MRETCKKQRNLDLKFSRFEKFELFEPLNGGGPFAANGEDVLSIVDGRTNVAAARDANGEAALTALGIDDVGARGKGRGAIMGGNALFFSVLLLCVCVQCKC